MIDTILNIGGSEWILIIFVGLIVLFGTNRLPDVAKKLGKVMGEYNKAKNEFTKQINEYNPNNMKITEPVQNEREKLELMAKSLKIPCDNKTDEKNNWR